MVRLNVYATSFAVSGCPSDHFSPGWILNVQVSPSVDFSQESASCGTGPKSSSDQPVSRSYMMPWIS